MKHTPNVYKRLLGETDEAYALFLEVAKLAAEGSTIAAALKAVAVAHGMAETPSEWPQWAKQYMWKARLQRVLGALTTLDESTIAIRTELDGQSAPAELVNQNILDATAGILSAINAHLLTGAELPDRALIAVLPSLLGASAKLQDLRLDRLEKRRKDTIHLELWNN